MVRVVTEKEAFKLYGNLNGTEESLKASKASFLRVHQSFLVNYKHVNIFEYDFVIMDSEKRISISEERQLTNSIA